jgi:hypothetical protein
MMWGLGHLSRDRCPVCGSRVGSRPVALPTSGGGIVYVCSLACAVAALGLGCRAYRRRKADAITAASDAASDGR